MEQKATIYRMDDTEVVSEKFSKRLIILREVWPSRFGEQENFLPVQFSQEKIAYLDQFKVGDEVVVKFNLDGRLWQKDEDAEEMCFINLNGFSIALAANVAAPEAQSPPEKKEGAPPKTTPQVTNPVDDGGSGDPPSPGDDNGPDALPF